VASRKKVLVTGADGFIGSHLAERLVHLGYDVRAFVMYNSLGSWGWLDYAAPEVQASMEIFPGDIRDQDCVRLSMKGQESVLHLAALVSVPYSYQAPSSFIETNITGTLNVVQAAKDLDVHKAVCVSTSEVYGTAKFVPISEDHPLQPQSPYSASKIGAEHIAMSFYHAYNTPVAVARPFNTYGPRQSGRAVLPAAMIQLASGKKKIKIGSTSPTRDFNFVDDTVSGLIAMMESDKSIGQVVNLGGSYEVSIGDALRLIAELMQIELDIETDEGRLRPAGSEVERLWADNSKAKRILGWQPAYGGLEGFKKGLLQTLNWFKDPVNLQLYKSDIYQV